MLPASSPAPAPCVSWSGNMRAYVLTFHQIKAICCTRPQGGHKNGGDKSAWPPPLTADGCRFHAALHTYKYTQHARVWKPVAAFIYFPTNLLELNTHRDAYAQRGEPGRLPAGPARPRGRNTVLSTDVYTHTYTHSTSKALLSRRLKLYQRDNWAAMRIGLGAEVLSNPAPVSPCLKKIALTAKRKRKRAKMKFI